MKKTDAIKFIDEKIEDLKHEIAVTKVNAKISKTTRGTKLYALSKERRVLQLLRDVIEAGGDKVILPEDSLNTFTLITTLSSERVVRTGFEAVVGESLQVLVKRYPNKTMNKIEEQLAKKGLMLDTTTYTVVEMQK